MYREVVNEKTQISFGKDNIVIRKHIAGVEGGRTLQIPDGFTAKVINAGHVIVKNGNEYEPLAVSGSAYAALGDKKVVGLLEASIETKKADAAILTAGVVNEVAAPYPFTEEIKKALPHIIFMQDEAVVNSKDENQPVVE